MYSSPQPIAANIQRTIREYATSALCSPSSPLLIALSGGADSIALLHACIEEGIPAHAAHCNFHLRGEESDRDEAFVARQCELMGIKLHIANFDTRQFMATTDLSLEEACRKLRYDWFRKLKHDYGYCRIVLAHHRDDNAETLLLNLLRGAGPDGLKGMVADTGELLRPFLKFSRENLREYLRSIDAPFITDSSNLDPEAADRNFLRLEVLPLLRSRWKGIDTAIETARRNAERASKISKAYLSSFIQHPSTILKRKDVMQCADAPSLVHHFLGELSKSDSQIEEISRAMLAAPGRGQSWMLHQNLCATYRGENITISTVSTTPPPFEITEQQIPGPRVGGILTKIKTQSRRDATLLPFPLKDCTLRHPYQGEKIQPFGARGVKRINELLREAGIPSCQRAHYPVLTKTDTDEVLWIPGIRRSALHTVSTSHAQAWLLEMKPLTSTTDGNE